MGTIVRLLEKHQNPQSSVVGCFHNLYKSVSDMDVDSFETPACKNLLLYPRSAKESHCRKLKLNIDDTEATKFFLCPNFISTEACCKVYSNFSTTKCRCGSSMTREIQVEGEQEDGAFLSCRTSFIITDDLKVALNSMGLVLNILNDLGYAGFDKLQEMLIDVGFQEGVCSLRKRCMTRKRKMLTPLLQESRVPGEADKLLTLKVYVKKTDRAILYAECREEFVDFHFTLLAIPLEFAWELSIDNVNMGCVGNLCKSVKDLSFEKQKEATFAKCMLPYYYNFSAQLLDIIILELPEYERLVPRSGYSSSYCKFSRKIKKDVLSNGERIVKFTPVPKAILGSPYHGGVGFVKGETNFIVSDDLIITPMNSSSTISLLSKLQLSMSDIEEQVITFGKAEAISLLRASLITTSVLTNGLSNFLAKVKPKEATPSTSKIPKSENPL